MKKFATVLLALALIATLSVASFAATVPSSEGEDLAVDYTAMTADGHALIFVILFFIATLATATLFFARRKLVVD